MILVMAQSQWTPPFMGEGPTTLATLVIDCLALIEELVNCQEHGVEHDQDVLVSTLRILFQVL